MQRGAVVVGFWGIAWIVGCTTNPDATNETATRSGEETSDPGLVRVLDACEAVCDRFAGCCEGDRCAAANCEEQCFFAAASDATQTCLQLAGEAIECWAEAACDATDGACASEIAAYENEGCAGLEKPDALTNDAAPAPLPSSDDNPRNVADAPSEPPASPSQDAGAPVEPNPPEPDEPTELDPSLGEPDAPPAPVPGMIEPTPGPTIAPEPTIAPPDPPPTIEPSPEPVPEPMPEPMIDGGAPVRSTTGPSFAETVGPILNLKCTASCHEPGGLLGGPGGLGTSGVYQDLTLNAAYETLTTRPSVELPTMWLVGTGLDDSYLWHKLNDTYEAIGGEGAKMPVTGELTAEELEAIRAWIEGGASP